MMRYINGYRALLQTALAALLFAACDRQPAGTGHTGRTPIDIVLSTRASDPDVSYMDVTYRACLFNLDGSYYGSGTYCNPAPDWYEWLMPCSVRDNGTFIRPDVDCGLYAENNITGNANYTMVLFSPAVNLDVSSGMFQMDRDPGDSPSVSFASPSTIAVSNSFILNHFVYDCNKILYEKRSKINVNVTCGEDIRMMTLNSVRLANVINRANYNLLTEEYSTEGVSDAIGEVTLYDTDTPLSNPSAGSPVTCNAVEGAYVFSMDYSAFDLETETLIHPTPVLRLLLNGSSEPISIPLNFDFRPMNIYTFDIIVNSISVTVNVTMAPWQNRAVNGEISNNDGFSFTMDIVTWDTGVDGDDGNIEFK